MNRSASQVKIKPKKMKKLGNRRKPESDKFLPVVLKHFVTWMNGSRTVIYPESYTPFWRIILARVAVLFINPLLLLGITRER